jgi:5-methylthioadenosine/S-adenosylhomocysteine deaminase
VFDPISHLVYAAGRNMVTDVWVAGQHLLKDRRLTTLDEADILRKTGDWQHHAAGYHAPAV